MALENVDNIDILNEDIEIDDGASNKSIISEEREGVSKASDVWKYFMKDVNYHREIFWGADLRRFSEIISAQILYPGAILQRKNFYNFCAELQENKVLRQSSKIKSAN